MLAIVVAVFLALLPAQAAANSAIPITECRALVPAGQRAMLVNDIDCAFSSTTGVVLYNRATLDLNGHRIANAENVIYLFPYDADGSNCHGACSWTVRGPGEVSGTRHGPIGTYDNSCVRIWGRGVLEISDVAIRDCDGSGIAGQFADVRATRVTIDDVRFAGIFGEHVRAQYVAISNAGGGLEATETMSLRSVRVHNTDGVGVGARQLRGHGVEISQNAGHGVETHDRTYLSRFVVTENAGFGVATTGRVTLSGSVVINNGEQSGGIDIAAAQKPLLRQSSCGRSADINNPSTSFGVCVSDP